MTESDPIDMEQESKKIVYKFKPCNDDGKAFGDDLATKDLSKDSLYVSNMYNQNDPCEWAFFIDKEKLSPDLLDKLDWRVEVYRQNLLRNIYAICLSESWENQRLWNYYSNGLFNNLS